MANGDRLMLLDTASLYFRAFYGVPDSLTAPDGTPVNAVRGLLDFIATLTENREPQTVVACWDDDWRPAWRVALLPTYKAHRVVTGGEAEEAPSALEAQVPVIKEALGLLGIPVVGMAEAEADDVIGTLAHMWDGPVDVVTGDRDLFQLVEDERPTQVLYTARGVSKHDVVDNSWIRARYGIDAAQYVDFAVMRGDASDGLPGVAGIGEKTAAALLETYGDLDGIMAAAGDANSSLKPQQRQSLIDATDYIANARTVVTVLSDLDTSVPPMGPTDPSWEEFADHWGVSRPASRAVDVLSRSRHR